ncbi:LOW QUALITY PROTEIN: SURP and G-patch domain-containing protein 1 [Plecturocebus cupreus]
MLPFLPPQCRSQHSHPQRSAGKRFRLSSRPTGLGLASLRSPVKSLLAPGHPECHKQWLDIKVSPPEGAETQRQRNWSALLQEKAEIAGHSSKEEVAEIRKEAQKSQAASQKVSPPEDEEVKNLAEKLARFITDGAPQVETIALQNKHGNQAFSFLYEPNSQGSKSYRQKLEDTSPLLRPCQGPRLRSPSSAPAARGKPPSAAPPPRPVKRKRKSRRRPEENKVEQPLAELVQPDVDASPSPLSEKPVGLVGVTELLDAQKKQPKEQQEMQRLYHMIMQHKRAMQDMQLLWGKAVQQQQQQEYDSDKECELGTWERPLRRVWTRPGTKMGRAKHCRGDCLPPDQLEKFMETFKALKEHR